MKFVDWTLPCVIAAVSWSCAGVLDNPEDFREAQEAVTTGDAGAGDGPREDAGTRWRDAAVAGATGAAGAKASAGAGGTAGWDSEDDAGVALAGAGGAGSGGAGSPAAGSGGSGSFAAGSGGAGAGGAPAGAAGSSPDAGMPDAGPACDFRGIVMMKCAGASCHGGPTASTGLDLTSPSLATRVQGRNSSGACSDTLLIDKDNPAESALYQRVVGSSCGVRMPLGGTLTPAEQACFLTWIEGL